ncbi:hypothetical protein MP638_005422 [Amoeboaphelidium occidentale]|nr:hypothetical protein MP638_005422 [Amoeboaphelidium occidentale]
MTKEIELSKETLSADDFNAANFVRSYLNIPNGELSEKEWNELKPKVTRMNAQLNILEQEVMQSLDALLTDPSVNFVLSGLASASISSLSRQTDEVLREIQGMSSAADAVTDERKDKAAESEEETALSQLLKLIAEKEAQEAEAREAEAQRKWSLLPQQLAELLVNNADGFVAPQNLIKSSVLLKEVLVTYSSGATKSGASSTADINVLVELKQKVLDQVERTLKNVLETGDSSSSDAVKACFETCFNVKFKEGGSEEDVFWNVYFESRSRQALRLFEEIKKSSDSAVTVRRRFFEELYVVVNGEYTFMLQLRRFFEELYVVVNGEYTFMLQLYNGIRAIENTSLQRNAMIVLDRLCKLLFCMIKGLPFSQDNYSKEWSEDTKELYLATEVFVLWIEKLIFANENIASEFGKAISSAREWSDVLFLPFVSIKQNFQAVMVDFYSSKILACVPPTLRSLSDLTSILADFTLELKTFMPTLIENCRVLMHGRNITQNVSNVLEKVSERCLKEISKKIIAGYSQYQASPEDGDFYIVAIKLRRVCIGVYDVINSHFSALEEKNFNSIEKKNEELYLRLKNGLSPYNEDGQFHEGTESIDDYDYVRHYGTINSILNTFSQVQSQPETKGAASPKELSLVVVLTQFVLCQALFRPIKSLLADYSKQNWTQNSSQKTSIVGDMPTFSLSASQIIQRVGEALMNLPIILDSVIQEEAQHKTKGVLSLGIQYLEKISSSNSIPNQVPDVKADAAVDEDPYYYARLWMIQIVRNTLNYYIFQQVLRIPASSVTVNFGVKQLLADINHVLNVVTALGLVPDLNGVDEDTNESSILRETRCAYVLKNILKIIGSSPDHGKVLLKDVWKSVSKKETETSDAVIQMTTEQKELCNNLKDDVTKRVFVQTVGLISGFRFDF